MTELVEQVRPPRRRLYGSADVIALTGKSIKTIQAWSAKGQFPAAYKLGGRLVWDANAVDRYMAELPGAVAHAD